MASHYEYVRVQPMASRLRENFNVNTCSKLSLDDRVRFLLMLNDAVALSLAFAAGDNSGNAAFAVLGIFLTISFVLNVAIVLVGAISRHSQGSLVLSDGNHAPSLSVLALDVFIVIASLILYIITTVAAAESWNSVVMMVYASVGALVAM